MKKVLIRLILTVVMLILAALLFILPPPYNNYAAMGAPALFFSVLAALSLGTAPGIIVGAGVPLLEYILAGTEGVLFPETCMWILVYVLTGAAADLSYRAFRIPAASAVIGLLAGRILLLVFRVAVCLISGGSYMIGDYVKEAYTDIWPGLILTLILVPVLMLILKKSGLLKKLRKVPEEKEIKWEQ